MISIEIFVSPICQRCNHTTQLIKHIATEYDTESFGWHRIDVVEELDYAVESGVLATPSIAIDGSLVFTSPPSEKALRHAIEQRIKGSRS